MRTIEVRSLWRVVGRKNAASHSCAAGLLLALACLLLARACAVSGQDVRSRLKGLVFESEDWSEPKSAWEKDKRSPDKWCLWTTEGPGKRSGDRSLVSPPIQKDRAKPEEGAPVLHMHITGIPPNTYIAYLGPTTRPLAFSLDGKTWEATHGGETCLGIFDIKDGVFDLWVDDRYANPPNIGPTYFDYVRLEPSPPPQFHDLRAFTLPDGRTQLSWYTSAPIRCLVEYGRPGRVERAKEASREPLRNHRVFLDGLTPGEPYEAHVCMKVGGRVSGVSPVLRFIAGERPKPANATRPARLRLTVREPTQHPRKQWPVTSGVPFPQGVLARVEDVALRAASGEVLPAQFEASSFWPDGSVHWLTISFLADTTPGAPTPYHLETSSDMKAPTAGDVKVEENPETIILSNSKLRLRISRKSFALFEDLRMDRNSDGAFTDEEIVTGQPETGNMRIISADGAAYGLGAPDRIFIEESGPIRSMLRIEGSFAANQQKLFRYRIRLSLYAHQPFLGVNVTIGNDNTDAHLTPLRAAGMRLPIRPSSRVAQSPSDAPRMRGAIDGMPPVDITTEDSLSLLQDYDNRYTLMAQEQVTRGERSLGIAQAEANGLRVSAVVKDFWQTYPKGLAVKPDGIHVRLLPPLAKEQYTSPEDTKNFIMLYYWCRDGLYQFRSGLEYTADVFVRFDETNAAPPAPVIAAHFQNPLFAAAEPRAYCESGAFGPVAPQLPGEFDDYAAMVERGYQGVEETRLKRHEYGWMNFGDWFGERKYNWGNSEYDLAWCMALHFARTGDLKYLWRGAEMTRHYTTIDTIHYPMDSTAAGIVYAHSAGHVGGFFAQRDARFNPDEWKHWYGSGYLAGAIDPGGHIYQTGNLIYGFLLGDRRYSEVAERVVAQQAAYLTRNFDFGIERAAGWPLINAVSAYRATGNPFFLNAAHIYLEKILEKQDSATGGWRMPQGHGECDCPDAGKETHMGGKAFATGILLHGLILYDQVSPSPEVKTSIVRAADWLMNHSWNKEKRGFRYKTGCPKYLDNAGLGGTAALVAEGIAYAYEVTKDPKYKDFLLGWLGQVMTATPKDGKSYSMLIRQLPQALYYVKRWGVTQLPKALEPEK